MSDYRQEKYGFEICVVVPRRNGKKENRYFDCVDVLVKELKHVGFIVDRAMGLTAEFIKLAASPQTLGKAAAGLQMKKLTYIGMDLQFEWEEAEAFVRQPDGSLFSWMERFECYHHLLYGIVNKSKLHTSLKWDGKEYLWEAGESLMQRLELEGVVKQVFPLHVEIKRKKLLREWVLNWRNFTKQPIDYVYSYFGLKIAMYFAFLRMYTRWMLFPAVYGLIVQLVHFGSLQFLVLPAFFISIIIWAVLFFQFWKRKNHALLARWHYSANSRQENNCLGVDWNPLQPPLKLLMQIDKLKEKETYQRYEWVGHLMRFRNNSFIIASIICLQLPFELAYAHLYEVMDLDVAKYGLTAIYLVVIQYFTKIGGKISMKLIQHENNENTEYQADSLVYKVFGLYFMQSYIGVFYHALFHRNFMSLRQVLIQRLIVCQVLENLLEKSLPYLKYSYKKFRAVRDKKKQENEPSNRKVQFKYSKVEKEYLKPTYSASIGEELEDGLFDDFLQLALQFGMIMMFACAFPLAFALAAVNNFTEIRTDAMKLLTMMKRPVPRAATSIGAWLNIFQFLIVMSICTNSVLLVCLYDQEGKWKIEPGLAAILILEHTLLLIKFGISRFLPEEPAWVRANRIRNATQAQDMYSKQLLRSIAEVEKTYGLKKID
ncbi:anoctamin-like protein At1g73020 isoform X2 [Euphorbia lathyris]|uniref:anoctamin-like protein At1g73020 isoform X2 n=1 Tax=Euphorbia lathyris TaxID=212925 RepID=UPI003314194B